MSLRIRKETSTGKNQVSRTVLEEVLADIELKGKEISRERNLIGTSIKRRDNRGVSTKIRTKFKSLQSK